MTLLARGLCRLGFYGLAAHAETWVNEPWLAREIEETERQHRSLKPPRQRPFRRLPTPALVEELFSFAFIKEAANVVLIGPNGLGKTMLVKNLA